MILGHDRTSSAVAAPAAPVTRGIASGGVASSLAWALALALLLLAGCSSCGASKKQVSHQGTEEASNNPSNAEDAADGAANPPAPRPPDDGSVAANDPPPRPQVELLRLPAGFRVSVFSRDVPNARAMALGAKGTLFVGTRQDGRVYALVDRDRDQQADRVYVIDKDLHMPAGVDFHNGSLYVSAVDRILRYDNIESRLDDPPEPVVVSDAFPDEPHHGWKFIRFGPDGMLYVPVGAPCNICKSSDERFATIMRMRPDGSGLEIFARGIRNTVGFDWHPKTRELWFTENGRDWLGDNVPPDELNRAPRKGMHFGYPFCHGGTIPDPEYGQERPCSELVPPEQNLAPHTAALGMRFYTGTMFPEKYRGAVIIAEHGSWNRSTPIGYRLTLVQLDRNNRVTGYEPFIEGWLQAGEPGQEEDAWGRPVDVLVHPDGSLYVSDDRAGSIYRVTYSR